MYGGGGNSGATYTNDFIEIFNAGPTPIDLSNWSVQYLSAGASGAWQVTPISCSPSTNCVVAPGRYFLVQESAGNGGTTPLPAADATGSIPMGATAAKVALVNSPIALSGCPAPGTVADLVGYGATANCAEGSAPAPTLSNTSAAIRRGNGCTDTDNNSADFVADGPIPRNSASPVNACGGDPTMPSGFGIAIPDSMIPASNTLLTVRVTSASAPPSTGLAVVADLTSIGGSASQAFFDDGTHGDELAGDNIFSLETTIGAATQTGTYSVVATIMDAERRSVTAPITLSVESLTCGVERWAVKVGTDSTVGDVRLDLPPTPATIEYLGSLAPPSEADIDAGNPPAVPPGQFAFARDEPVESTLYQVDGTITFFKLETDVDYHIVVSDLGQPEEHTIITEIPNPGCIITTNPPRTLVNGPFSAGIAKAREKFDARLTATTSFQSVSIPVRVRGVGFFDFEHGQTGIAPNAIEIHPILDIFFRANSTTTLQSSGTLQFGQLATFTTTVTNGDGSGTPTGTVTFFDGGNSYTAALDQNGQASFSTAALAPGSHSMTVSYEGDDTDLPSQSPALAFDVAKGDQSIAFAALTNKAFGDPPFTVSATGGASGNPVAFTAGGVCSASGPNGSTITLTTAGSCSVTASQSGNANYLAASPVSRTFTVVDARPPVISAVTPSVTSIWPPNKKMVPVTIAVSATDDVDPTPACSVAGVSSNEAGAAEWTISGTLSVSLQADRAGSGDGRIYTITVRCVDGSGNASQATTRVSVPHDRGR